MRGLLFACAIAGACTKSNPNYCPEAPLHNCLLADAGKDVSSACTSIDDCAGMVCDLQSGMCVQCTPEDTSACNGKACIANTCTACTTDNDCASGVCRADGTCADETATLYATMTAAGTATCTKADKCTLTTALGKLSATASVIHLDPGTYSDAVSLTKDAALVGKGAIIERATGAVVNVGASRNVALEGLVLRAASTSNGVSGINVGQGALVAIRGCEIGPTEGLGVAMTAGGSLVIARSTVHDNVAGGIQITGTAMSLFDLTNTMIYVNGGNTFSQNVGGVAISAPLATGSRIDYVTIVDNAANNNASAHAGGIVCDASTFAITNSIIANNTVGNDPNAGNANTFGMCAKTTGDVVQAGFTGLALRDPANHDYHLTAGSVAEGHATATGVMVDIDGDTRPQGTGYDSGADELQ